VKSLIWKEWQENFKWVLLPTLVIIGPMGVMGMAPLMDSGYLLFVGLVTALFAGILGFLQVFPESRGDKRALLLHRPLSPSRIFLSKALAGAGLYFLALGIPFACAVALAATPGHIHEPFSWGMALPWLADMLTGFVYYFAGMLTAQREARWYGSRCLGMATGLACSILVWTVPEFWQALLAIVIFGALVATAAWGTFLTGSAYPRQPVLAKGALVTAFLTGLLALGFTGEYFLGAWLSTKSEHWYDLDRHGRVLLVHYENNQVQSATDREGQPPQDLQGQRLDYYSLKEITAPSAHGGFPRVQSYRNTNRFLIKYSNESKPGIEEWWYVPDQGRLLGYDKQSKRLIGTFGPDGFAPPEEHSSLRFQGNLAHLSFFHYSQAGPYLAFPDAVYTVDFRTRKLRELFVPPVGEKVAWASKWEEEEAKNPAPLVGKKTTRAFAFVGTDRSVYIIDQAGTRVLAAPLAYDRESHCILRVGVLDNPTRYWVWYAPAWYLKMQTLETLPVDVVMYDSAGRELSPRQEVAPRPGGLRDMIPPLAIAEPPSGLGLFGLVTPISEAAVLFGATQYLENQVRGNQGAEVPLFLRFLVTGTQYSLPGIRRYAPAHAGMTLSFVALMLMSSLVSALCSYALARRYAFSRMRRWAWSLCGLLFGPVGLLLMLAVQEWPALVPCPGCRRLRVVTRDTCEHCGAPHALPAPDGTEIFEAPTSASGHMGALPLLH
jgi:hypothetical protein